MTPRRLLNSREVGEKLGLSRRAVTQRLARQARNIPEPDFIINVPGRGDMHGWLPSRKDLQPPDPAPDDPALLGDDPSSLPDEFLIGPQQLGMLVGWSHQYVITQRWESGRRRAMGTGDATDLPPGDTRRGNSPRWAMGTFRAWQAARGKDISEEER